MKKIKNEEIRTAMKDKGVYQWEVAKALGVAESTLIRWLREELSAEQKEAILEAIQNI